MNDTLKKTYQFLGVSQKHEITLNISKDKFVEILKPYVGKDTSSSMDIFSSGDTNYKGIVGQSGFYLRRKRGFTTYSRHFCKAAGSFREENNQLIITIEFNNFPPPVIIFHGLFLIFFSWAIIQIIIGIFSFSANNLQIGLNGIFSTSVFFAIISAIVRIYSLRTIQTMKYELENNFHNYTKNYLP